VRNAKKHKNTPREHERGVEFGRWVRTWSEDTNNQRLRVCRIKRDLCESARQGLDAHEPRASPPQERTGLTLSLVTPRGVDTAAARTLTEECCTREEAARETDQQQQRLSQFSAHSPNSSRARGGTVTRASRVQRRTGRLRTFPSSVALLCKPKQLTLRALEDRRCLPSFKNARSVVRTIFGTVPSVPRHLARSQTR
jgi:hypothetical protein